MNLYKKIYFDIKERIEIGEFNDGTLMPTEKELQEKYNVSRITVKHAYQLLEEENLIQRIPGKGTVLKSKKQQQKKPIIGVIICDYDSSFGENLIKSIEVNAKKNGYRILVARNFEDHENESEIITDFINLGVSGIIIQNCHGALTKNLLKLYIQEFPVISVDRYSKNLLIPSVSSDNFNGSMEATEFVLKKGHKSILFATANPDSTSTLTDRLLGFEETFAKKNIPLNPQFLLTNLKSPIIRTPKNIEDDIEKIVKAIELTQCSAIIASEYFVLRLCEEAKNRLSKEYTTKIEMICFDFPNIQYNKNILTHVYQDESKLGEIAVNKLCSILNGKEVELRTFIPMKLIISEEKNS